MPSNNIISLCACGDLSHFNFCICTFKMKQQQQKKKKEEKRKKEEQKKRQSRRECFVSLAAHPFARKNQVARILKTLNRYRLAPSPLSPLSHSVSTVFRIRHTQESSQWVMQHVACNQASALACPCCLCVCVCVCVCIHIPHVYPMKTPLPPRHVSPLRVFCTYLFA